MVCDMMFFVDDDGMVFYVYVLEENGMLYIL